MTPAELLDLIENGHPDWHDQALCRQHPTIQFVPVNERSTATSKAIQICARCTVRPQCLTYAVADDTLTGVWGGTDTAARRAMRRSVS